MITNLRWIGYLISNLWNGSKPLPKRWLKHRITRAEFDEKTKFLARSDDSEYQQFMETLHPTDEIWFFTSPDWTWHKLMGREGYITVRDGKTTYNTLVTMMN